MADEKKPKKKSKPHVETEMSIQALADAFVHQMRLDSMATVHDDEGTVVGTRTHSSLTFHPIKAAILSLFLWGSGFLYVRRGWMACVFLTVFLFTLLLFLALVGFFPQDFGKAFLRDVGLYLPLSTSVIFLGFSLVVLWWISVVLPVKFALDSLPIGFRANDHYLLNVFIAPIPILGHYIKGRFWMGHFAFLSFMLLVWALTSLPVHWQEAARVERIDLHEVEYYFLVTLGILVGSTIFFSFIVMERVVQLFRDLNWLRAGYQGAQSDPKFVVLGLGVVLVSIGFGLFGHPGKVMNHRLSVLAQRLEKQNLEISAHATYNLHSAWRELQNRVDDKLDVIR